MRMKLMRMKSGQIVKRKGKLNYLVEGQSFCEPRLAEERLPFGIRSLQLYWEQVVAHKFVFLQQIADTWTRG